MNELNYSAAQRLHEARIACASWPGSLFNKGKENEDEKEGLCGHSEGRANLHQSNSRDETGVHNGH